MMGIIKICNCFRKGSRSEFKDCRVFFDSFIDIDNLNYNSIKVVVGVVIGVVVGVGVFGLLYYKKDKDGKVIED